MTSLIARPRLLDFALIRILGNSLPPRHGEDEMLSHLRFILDHEPELHGCEKSWVLNRIADERVAEACTAMIESAGQQVISMPFELDAYAQRFNDMSGVSHTLLSTSSLSDAATFAVATYALEWKHRYKSLYAISLNEARNRALSVGRARARWTLPWDGACFVTRQAWDQVLELAQRDEAALHLVVPLARVSDAQALLRGRFEPTQLTEPQLAFRCDSQERFDERLRYGNRNKAELLVRLGVPGPWQKWRPAVWDVHASPYSAQRDRFVQGAWVARLPALCEPQVEEHEMLRWRARFTGVAQLCKQLDERVVARRNTPARLLCYSDSALRDAGVEISSYLKAQAEAVLESPIPTILDKTGCAPSGDRRDYVSVAPYFHAESSQADLLHLDGVRNAAATPGSDQSRSYDRRALDGMVHAACVAALAGALTSDKRCLDFAASVLRTWFVDEATRMNPHMRYAQMLPGSQQEGRSWGLVDFRNFWPLLDAVTLVRRAGALSLSESDAIQAWFVAFLDDITARPIGQEHNNIAVWRDLVVASIAAFVGRNDLAAQVLADAPLRLSAQLSPFAVPHFEMERSRPLHYGLFLAQGLSYLAWLGRLLGVDLWRYQASQARSVSMLVRFLALNGPVLPDYPTDAQAFDARIASVVSLVPEDAVNYAAVAALRASAIPMSSGDTEHGEVPYFRLLGPARKL